MKTLEQKISAIIKEIIGEEEIDDKKNIAW